MVLYYIAVDHKYRFTDIYIGWPGSVHDARVLVHSSLYEKAIGENLFPSSSRSIAGESVPLFILGDSAYSLMTWLIKPFPHNSMLSDQQKTYNYRTSRARIVVENAYGRLKGRWRHLMKKNEMDVWNIPIVISACCVLHNMCEIHGDTFNDSWLQQDNTQNSQYRQPPTIVHHGGTGSRPKKIHDALVTYFST